MSSQSVQDYLKAIYEIVCEGGQEWASTSGLARVLELAPASVTAMLKKLAATDPPLLVHELYQGARLTQAGEKAALEVVRHHRLIESFLSAALKYSWDEVHAEAHRLEHAISEELEERLAAYLGQPQHDPHGSPIPARDGAIVAIDDMRLSDLPTGRQARVRRVSDHDSALLRYLSELGLTLDTAVRITARDPFDGPMHVHLRDADKMHALGKGITDHVFVVPIDD